MQASSHSPISEHANLTFILENVEKSFSEFRFRSTSRCRWLPKNTTQIKQFIAIRQPGAVVASPLWGTVGARISERGPITRKKISRSYAQICSF